MPRVRFNGDCKDSAADTLQSVRPPMAARETRASGANSWRLLEWNLVANPVSVVNCIWGFNKSAAGSRLHPLFVLVGSRSMKSNSKCEFKSVLNLGGAQKPLNRMPQTVAKFESQSLSLALKTDIPHTSYSRGLFLIAARRSND